MTLLNITFASRNSSYYKTDEFKEISLDLFIQYLKQLQEKINRSQPTKENNIKEIKNKQSKAFNNVIETINQISSEINNIIEETKKNSEKIIIGDNLFSNSAFNSPQNSPNQSKILPTPPQTPQKGSIKSKSKLASLLSCGGTKKKGCFGRNRSCIITPNKFNDSTFLEQKFTMKITCNDMNIIQIEETNIAKDLLIKINKLLTILNLQYATTKNSHNDLSKNFYKNLDEFFLNFKNNSSKENQSSRKNSFSEISNSPQVFPAIIEINTKFPKNLIGKKGNSSQSHDSSQIDVSIIKKPTNDQILPNNIINIKDLAGDTEKKDNQFLNVIPSQIEKDVSIIKHNEKNEKIDQSDFVKEKSNVRGGNIEKKDNQFLNFIPSRIESDVSIIKKPTNDQILPNNIINIQDLEGGDDKAVTKKENNEESLHTVAEIVPEEPEIKPETKPEIKPETKPEIKPEINDNAINQATQNPIDLLKNRYEKNPELNKFLRTIQQRKQDQNTKIEKQIQTIDQKDQKDQNTKIVEKQIQTIDQEELEDDKKEKVKETNPNTQTIEGKNLPVNGTKAKQIENLKEKKQLPFIKTNNNHIGDPKDKRRFKKPQELKNQIVKQKNKPPEETTLSESYPSSLENFPFDKLPIPIDENKKRNAAPPNLKRRISKTIIIPPEEEFGGINRSQTPVISVRANSYINATNNTQENPVSTTPKRQNISKDSKFRIEIPVEEILRKSQTPTVEKSNSIFLPNLTPQNLSSGSLLKIFPQSSKNSLTRNNDKEKQTGGQIRNFHFQSVDLTNLTGFENKQNNLSKFKGQEEKDFAIPWANNKEVTRKTLIWGNIHDKKNIDHGEDINAILNGSDPIKQYEVQQYKLVEFPEINPVSFLPKKQNFFSPSSSNQLQVPGQNVSKEFPSQKKEFRFAQPYDIPFDGQKDKNNFFELQKRFENVRKYVNSVGQTHNSDTFKPSEGQKAKPSEEQKAKPSQEKSDQTNYLTEFNANVRYEFSFFTNTNKS